MAILLHCQGCQKPLKVKEELAGKKVKCPSCGVPILVPVPEVEVETEPELVEAEMDEAVISAKPEGQPTKVGPTKGRKASGGSQWIPCPKCGTPDPKRVKFTFWGSFYGPKLFNHVRCLKCGATYNGRTGGSNIIPAIGCITVPLIGIVLILCALGFVVWYKLVYLPNKPDEEPNKGKRSEAIVREYVPLSAYVPIRPKS